MDEDPYISSLVCDNYNLSFCLIISILQWVSALSNAITLLFLRIETVQNATSENRVEHLVSPTMRGPSSKS